MTASQLMYLTELSRASMSPSVKESAKNLLTALKSNADDILADPSKRKAALGVAGLTAGVGAVNGITDNDSDDGSWRASRGGHRGPYKVEYY